MTLKIDAADCLLSFSELPLIVKYSDARGDISSELTKISMNLIGCDKATEKYEPILRPFFNLTADDLLEYTLKVGESWTWSIPEPQHEDNSTYEHTFAFKVTTVKPMSFMEYFDQTLLLDIAQNATKIEDVGVYEIKISLKDEKKVTSLEPLMLRITVEGETETIIEANADSDEETTDEIDSDELDKLSDEIIN